MKKMLPDWLVLWIWKSLLGEVYSNIRVISADYNDENILTLRYYLDREPTDDDWESANIVVTNIFSNTSDNEVLKDIKTELIYSEKIIKELDGLGEFVYIRKE